jgi:hydroxyacylglutathione hydrolase
MDQHVQLAPALRLVRADNPSPMTGDGTNTYLLGHAQIAIIDPGPDDPAHLDRLLQAVGDRRVAVILVTHSHRDHSALAPALSAATGAPVLAYGDSRAGRSELMQRLAADGVAQGGEGVDDTFSPDRDLRDGAIIDFGPETITAIWTPGHMANHMCYMWRDMVFTGDHIMGWAPSLVSPPDGDMSAYMASLSRIETLAARIVYPGHGAAVTDPAARISALIAHRTAREAAIISTMNQGADTVAQLVSRIYADTPAALHAAAARNVFAHLVDLHARNIVTATPALRPDATFRMRRR